MTTGVEQYGRFLNTMPDAALLVDTRGVIAFASSQVDALLGYRDSDVTGHPVGVLVPDALRTGHDALIARYLASPGRRAFETIGDLHARHRNGGLIPVDILLQPMTFDETPLTLCVIRDVTSHRRLETRLRHSEAQYRALVENASEVFYSVAVGTDPLRGRVTFVSPQALALTGHPSDAFERDPSLWLQLIHPGDLPTLFSSTQQVLSSRRTGTREYRIRHDGEGVYRWVEDRVVPQIDAESGAIVGYQGVARDITDRWWQQQQSQALVTLGSTLRDCHTRDAMLEALLDGIIRLFEAGGAAFASRALDDHEVCFEMGRGALAAWTGRRVPATEAISAQVMTSGVPYVANAARDDARLSQRGLPDDAAAYASVPVQAQHAIGALVVTKGIPFVEREVTVLRAIGEMAAIALQRQMLHERVVQTAAVLEDAYESTIEGWARALDLRDRITEGHTRRVTELTLRLARSLEVPDEQLPHIRRGAMLHDIGKMGVPDYILQKPGPLTAEERSVMRRHTEYATQLLAPIEFLRPALEIPSSHHERWDGTGYPHGLKGEQIPWAARIFAVADVYDAITSTRPYGPAESHEEALSFIAANSGTHFDPRVVSALLALDLAGATQTSA